MVKTLRKPSQVYCTRNRNATDICREAAAIGELLTIYLAVSLSGKLLLDLLMRRHQPGMHHPQRRPPLPEVIEIAKGGVIE
jgi:hypothetical protein